MPFLAPAILKSRGKRRLADRVVNRFTTPRKHNWDFSGAAPGTCSTSAPTESEVRSPKRSSGHLEDKTQRKRIGGSLAAEVEQFAPSAQRVAGRGVCRGNRPLRLRRGLPGQRAPGAALTSMVVLAVRWPDARSRFRLRLGRYQPFLRRTSAAARSAGGPFSCAKGTPATLLRIPGMSIFMAGGKGSRLPGIGSKGQSHGKSICFTVHTSYLAPCALRPIFVPPSLSSVPYLRLNSSRICCKAWLSAGKGSRVVSGVCSVPLTWISINCWLAP